ncbi:MAG: metallophosphoesterase [Leptospiraceae bacterium]|nr:metallophosphoesterase [Leptospiraceae bacterium]
MAFDSEPGKSVRMKKESDSRTIFVGDVHGCREELEIMIERLNVTSSDRIIMLGDLINRGPDPVGVVRFVYERGFESLMGNHEDEYLRHFQGMEPYKSLRRELGSELHEWLTRRPLFIDSDDFIAVHAGLEPHKHPSESARRILLTIRTWDGQGVNLKEAENPPWYDFYQDSKPVFYGHWARKGLNIRSNTYGLDSGCVYGRALSAYILETHTLVQVPALRTHYIPPSLRTRQTSSHPG